MPDLQLHTWWQPVTVEMTHAELHTGVEHANGLSFPDEESTQKVLHIRYCLPKSRTPREITWEVEEKTDQKTKILELFLNFILGTVPYFTSLNDCFGFLLLSVSGKRRVNFRFKTKTGGKNLKWMT